MSLRQRLVDRCLNFDDGHLHDRTRLRRDSCWHLNHNNVVYDDVSYFGASGPR